MAKIQLGIALSEASGALGNTVFLKLPNSGNVLRERVSPFNPGTSPQSTARTRLTDVSRAWSTITQAQRDAWDAYAVANPVPGPFGGTVTLSGMDWYSRCNLNLLSVGELADQADPPSNAAPATPTGTTITTATATDLEIDTTAVGVATQAWFTTSLSVGRKAQASDYRQVGVIAAGTPPQSYDAFADYSARFGAPVVGRRIWAFVRTVNSEGLASAEDFTSIVVS